MPPLTLPPLELLRTLWNIAYSVAWLLHQPAVALVPGHGFYTMFATPVMIFSITVAEPMSGGLRRRKRLFKYWAPCCNRPLAGIHATPRRSCSGAARLAASVIGALVLVYTAAAVFVELDDSINAIWSTPAVHALHPEPLRTCAGDPAVAIAGPV